MFPMTLFNKLPALNRFWLKDVSHHHFWQCLYELKPLYISQVQRLVQQAISVWISNSKFPWEIHQFTNKTLIRSLIEFILSTVPEQQLAHLRECSCAPHLPNNHLQDCALLKLGEKKCSPLRYDHISAVAVALWCYLIDACLGTQHNSANVGLTVTTCTSYRYSYISMYLPN